MYAEFWKRTAAGHVMPEVGSDSMLYFDGRWSHAHCISHARRVCHQHGHYGFTMRSGPMNRPADRETRPLEVVS